ARSVYQARQLINHGHVVVGGGKVTAPGYHVMREEDNALEIRLKVAEQPKAAAEAAGET
ncbi:MAG: hypothetical protein GTO63_27155, partial [Anaerolineae bacterium]|nr:hypothetical protein [Anaerolineae bacterium]NIN98415.1 hypothetical protein [Anaerolineae bacterium]NIQ81320.1 hypothetical protein [Anaerolineae bacterium]